MALHPRCRASPSQPANLSPHREFHAGARDSARAESLFRPLPPVASLFLESTLRKRSGEVQISRCDRDTLSSNPRATTFSIQSVWQARRRGGIESLRQSLLCLAWFFRCRVGRSRWFDRFLLTLNGRLQIEGRAVTVSNRVGTKLVERRLRQIAQPAQIGFLLSAKTSSILFQNRLVAFFHFSAALVGQFRKICGQLRRVLVSLKVRNFIHNSSRICDQWRRNAQKRRFPCKITSGNGFLVICHGAPSNHCKEHALRGY